VARLSKDHRLDPVNDFQFSFSDNRINIYADESRLGDDALEPLSTIHACGEQGITPANGPGDLDQRGKFFPPFGILGPWANAENLYTFRMIFSKAIGRHTPQGGSPLQPEREKPGPV